MNFTQRTRKFLLSLPVRICIKMMNLVLKMMNFEFKMTNLVFKMMNLVCIKEGKLDPSGWGVPTEQFEVAICVTIDEFCIKNDGFCTKHDGPCIQNDDFNANGQVEKVFPLVRFNIK